MLRHEGFGPAQESEGVFLLRPGGEDGAKLRIAAAGGGGACAAGRGAAGLAAIGVLLRKALFGPVGHHCFRQRQRARGKSAGAANHLHRFAGLAQGEHPQHRVVETGENGAVVAHEGVGHVGQLPPRFAIAYANGLVVQVARGHHQKRRVAGGFPVCLRAPGAGPRGCGEVVHQQQLHGGVGQHHSQLGQVVGQSFGEGGIRLFSQQHDGVCWIHQLFLLDFGHAAQAPRLIGRLHHHGEGFAVTPLPFPQRGQGLRIVAVAHQVVAPQPFDGQDAPLRQQIHRVGQDGVAGGAAVAPHQVQPGRFGLAGLGRAARSHQGVALLLP